MESYNNPDGWLDILGLFILAVAGAAGAIVPVWISRRKKDTDEKPPPPVEIARRLQAIEEELEVLLVELTQLRRGSAAFGMATTDRAIETLRKMAFESEERLKEAVRELHRDVKNVVASCPGQYAQPMPTVVTYNPGGSDE